jgi:hypothetical protein
VPLIPLALRIEAALLADSSKADGTAADDFLVLDADAAELVDDEVEEVEELAALEDADLVGWIG